MGNTEGKGAHGLSLESEYGKRTELREDGGIEKEIGE